MSSVINEVQPRYSSKKDITTITNKVFRPLLLAGTGGDGDVWVCEEDAPSARVSNTLGENNAHKPLYAVKIPSNRLTNPLLQESAALKAVADIPAPSNSHVQQYVNHDQLHEEPSWLASHAVFGCTLWQLQKVAERQAMLLPKSFILTIALQLCHAIQALRNLTPPIFHEDLCHSNIMLDMDSRDAKGVPTVVVIDFAHARSYESLPAFDLDLSSFYRVVSALVDWCDGSGSGEASKWGEFVGFVEGNKEGFEKRPLEEFSERCEGFGEELWEGMSEEECVGMNMLLEEASGVMLRAWSLAEGSGNQYTAP